MVISKLTIQEENYETKCIQYDISRSQRQREVKSNLGLEGTMGYEITGCYNCNGFQTKCPKYYTKWKLKN